MRWIVLGIMLMLLCGCASRWEHASKRSSEFYSDDRDCQMISGGATQALEPTQERTSYESCMWERGWSKKNRIWFFDPPERH
ncbi:MAG: hypothetical protein OET90_02945 [Desulfuromonadales bacterium]|nr:hypothetical protein [Desulfuromonadales bacterium]